MTFTDLRVRRRCLTLVTAAVFVLTITRLQNLRSEPAQRSAPASAPVEEWGQEVEGARAKLTLDKHSFRLGEPILMSLTVQNLDDSDLYVGVSRAEHEWKIHVVGIELPPLEFLKPNPDRLQIAPTLYAKSLSHPLRHPVSHRLQILGAQEAALVERSFIPLGRLFDLSLPGRYGVSVTRRVFRKGGSTWRITSNEVAFTVDDNPEQQVSGVDEHESGLNGGVVP